jgi:hypothetical protein
VRRCSCYEEKDSVVYFCVRLLAAKGYEKRLPSFQSKRNANPRSFVQNAHSCSTVSIVWEVIFEEASVAPVLTFFTESTSDGSNFFG